MKNEQWKSKWKWKNFKPSEVACKGKTCGCGGELWKAECVPKDAGETLNYFSGHFPNYFIESMDSLQKLRDAWGKSILINSAHRCENHNRNVGGAKASRHIMIAFDCVVPAYEQEKFVVLASKCGFNGIGLYPNRGFIHVDIRRHSANWVR